MNNQNQFAFTMNKGEEARHSEIPHNVYPKQQPAGGAHGLRRESSSDEENKQQDQQPNNQNAGQQRARPLLLQKAWKYDPTTGSNTRIAGDDGKYAASKQLAQQLSKPLAYTTIAIFILAVIIAGFRGPAFLLIDLNASKDTSTSIDCNQNPEIDQTNCGIQETKSIQGGYGLRVCWREMISALMLIPLVVSEYRREKKEEIDENRLYNKDHLLSKRYIGCIVICGLSHAIWTVTLCFAVFNTSVANAYIFNNIYPLFTLIGKLSPFNKHSHSNRTEILGGLLTAAVLVFLVLEDKSGAEGCLIALVGAIAASVFENQSTTTGQGVPSKFLAMSVSIVAVLLTGLYSLIFEGATLNTNEFTGILGVWSFQWIFAHVLISFITGFAKTEIDNFLDKVLSSLTKDVSIMTQTFPAILVATLLGFGQLPNLAEILTYIVYIIALSFLAIGKNESQIEEIALHDENNLKGHMQNQKLLQPINGKQGDQSGIELTNTLEGVQTGPINNNPYYQPPSYSPLAKQVKKTTMGGYENEAALNEGFKSKLLAQQQQSHVKDSGQYELEDQSNKLSQQQTHMDNYDHQQGTFFNQNNNYNNGFSNNNDFQNHNNNNTNDYQNNNNNNNQNNQPNQPIKEEEEEQGYFLNDSIGNFNMEFIKNLKKNKAQQQ